MKHPAIALCLLLTMQLSSGCIDEDCPSSNLAMRTVQILPVWPEEIQKPEGVRVLFYSLKNGKYVQDNFPAEGGVMRLREGEYATVLYNNDSEAISFKNNDEYELFEAYTKHLSRPSYVNPVPGEDTFGQPDRLWVANHDTVEVADVSIVVNYNPEQMVIEYIGFVAVDGLEQVEIARGAVTGMMRSCVLSSRRTKDQSSTLFFDAEIVKGGVTFTCRSFGRYLENGIPRKHYLTLEFLMKNSIASQNIDISHQIDSLIHGGRFRIDKTIVLPPDTTKEDGGIDADVGNWDEIIYPIPL